MKDYFLFALLAFSLDANAQFIVAGMHGSQDLYKDIVPDTVVHSVLLNPPTPYVDTFLLDITNDGVMDFSLVSYALGGGIISNPYQYCKIIPLNGNFIAIAGIDTCFDEQTPPVMQGRYQMLDPVGANDTINANRSWRTTTGFLAYLKACNDCLPNGYICTANSFPGDSKYVGVAVNDTAGPLYGWIKVKGVTPRSMTIEEYACEGPLGTGITRLDQEILLKGYPNPVGSTFRVEYKLPAGTSTADLVFRDLAGREINRHNISAASSHILVSVEGIPAGTYFYQLQTSGQSSAGKKMVVVK